MMENLSQVAMLLLTVLPLCAFRASSTAAVRFDAVQ
jgi:hypothetical protein